MGDKYNRKGEPISLNEWMNLFENVDYKVVQQDELPDGTLISTVWLGLDHSFGSGPPLIFETMVFPKGGSSDEMDRYCIEDEARKGHAAMLEKWKTKAPES